MITLRYGRALLARFRGTLLSLAGLVVLGGAIIASTPLRALAGARPPLDAALYAAWMALFAEQVFNSTEHWHLEAISALFPLFGAIVVGEGVVRLGLLLMSRRQGDKEWQKVVASTYRDHVVLCGLGHMGVRILDDLRDRSIPVVVIEKDAASRYMSHARSAKVVVIVDDMKNDEALIEAQVRHAKVLIAATNDDLANIEVALDARRLNPHIRIAMRQFDAQIAAKLQASFSIDFAFSSSAVAAPIISAQALGLSTPLTQVRKGDVALETLELELHPSSPLTGLRVDALEARFGVRVILARLGASAWAMPAQVAQLSAGDACVLIGPRAALESANDLACVRR